MANDIKIARLESTIKETINTSLSVDVNDKIAKNARVTAVRLSNDLSVAKIYIDVPKRQTINEVLDALKKVSGFLRSKLAENWKAYKLPELRFLDDETIGYASHLEELFKKIKKDEENKNN